MTQNLPSATLTAALRPSLLEWTGYTHPPHERSMTWYLTGGGLLLILALYGAFTGIWTLSVLTIVVGAAYFLTHRSPHAPKHIALQEGGVLYDGAFFPWDNCKDFWLIYTPEYTDLHIRLRRKMKEISIQTSHIDPSDIRSCVSQFLPVRPDQHERLMDKVIRICKL